MHYHLLLVESYQAAISEDAHKIFVLLTLRGKAKDYSQAIASVISPRSTHCGVKMLGRVWAQLVQVLFVTVLNRIKKEQQAHH